MADWKETLNLPRTDFPMKANLPVTEPAVLARWTAMAEKAGAVADVCTYPKVGHFFTDETLSDYDPAATDQTWERVLSFLNAI